MYNVYIVPVGNSCCRRSNDLRQLTPSSPTYNLPILYSVCATSVHDGAGCLEMKRSMTACLRSLTLEYCLLILSSSDCGMFTQRPNTRHRLSFMMSSTVERFFEVRLDSKNTHRERERRDDKKHIIINNTCIIHEGSHTACEVQSLK